MERLDDILGYNNLKIYQDSSFFSFSLDSIFLANYCNIRLKDKKIVDFCSGNGIIPLILTRRTKSYILGVEIQKKLFDLANKSILYNNLTDRILFINQDIRDFSKKNLNKFDLVLCNPPYFKVSKNSFFNISYEKCVARHEVLINLDELCLCVNRVLKDNGVFCMVHRTERLMEIFEIFRKYNIEPKRIKFLYENVQKDSFLVLVEGMKNGNVGLKIDKPLILYNLDGTETYEYEKIQREVNI